MRAANGSGVAQIGGGVGEPPRSRAAVPPILTTHYYLVHLAQAQPNQPYQPEPRDFPAAPTMASLRTFAGIKRLRSETDDRPSKFARTRHDDEQQRRLKDERIKKGLEDQRQEVVTFMIERERRVRLEKEEQEKLKGKLAKMEKEKWKRELEEEEKEKWKRKVEEEKEFMQVLQSQIAKEEEAAVSSRTKRGWTAAEEDTLVMDGRYQASVALDTNRLDPRPGSLRLSSSARSTTPDPKATRTNYTISQDHTAGKIARKKALLAAFGKKQPSNTLLGRGAGGSDLESITTTGPISISSQAHSHVQSLQDYSSSSESGDEPRRQANVRYMPRRKSPRERLLKEKDDQTRLELLKDLEREKPLLERERKGRLEREMELMVQERLDNREKIKREQLNREKLRLEQEIRREAERAQSTARRYQSQADSNTAPKSLLANYRNGLRNLQRSTRPS
jgi:hypothetical protein